MLRLLLFLALAALLPADDGTDDGRRGNALYESEAYEAAAEAYRTGLEAYAGEAAVPDAVHSGLLNNLGAALYRSDDFEGAQQAFASALRLAPTAAEATRAAYNAGNAAFRQENLDDALAFYREALLADPDNHDAKINYEFVKRMQEQQQEQQDQQQDGEGEQDNQDQQDGEGEQEQQQDGQQEQQDGEQEGDQDGDGQPDEEQESDQEQQGQAGDQGEQQQEQQAQPEPDPNQLSQQEAERILQALQNEETDLLREAMKVKARPRRVEKDW